VSRAVVTGASGFIGRAAVESLARLGFEVHAVARRHSPEVPVHAWHELDLLDNRVGAALFRGLGATHLLHLAWTTEHGRYWEDPANRDWVASTRRLVEAFGEAGGERVVLAGSCAQYDWSRREPFSEEETPRRPASLYGQTKQEAAEWLDASGIPSATGILFYPYGPFEPEGHLVPSVTLSLLAGEEAKTTPGAQVRDYVHVADCGAALAALVAGSATGSVNVGTGQGAPVAEIARTVARLVGREDLLRVGAIPGEDETRVVADTTRLREEVGFTPRYELEKGLREAVDWWRQPTRRR
jgi:nucleoside-diphosphate-sugar epimerase